MRRYCVAVWWSRSKVVCFVRVIVEFTLLSLPPPPFPPSFFSFLLTNLFETPRRCQGQQIIPTWTTIQVWKERKIERENKAKWMKYFTGKENIVDRERVRVYFVALCELHFRILFFVHFNFGYSLQLSITIHLRFLSLPFLSWKPSGHLEKHRLTFVWPEHFDLNVLESSLLNSQLDNSFSRFELSRQSFAFFSEWLSEREQT